MTKYILRSVNWQKRVVVYEVDLMTNRAHQIRIHFADAGFPIVGDPFYNLSVIHTLRVNPDKGFTGYMGLEAFLLQFPHPKKQERIKLELPMTHQFKLHSGLPVDVEHPLPPLDHSEFNLIPTTTYLSFKTPPLSSLQEAHLL